MNDTDPLVGLEAEYVGPYEPLRGVRGRIRKTWVGEMTNKIVCEFVHDETVATVLFEHLKSATS